MWRPGYSAIMETQAYWMTVHYIPLLYGDIKCNQTRGAHKSMDLMESMLSTIQFLQYGKYQCSCEPLQIIL